MKRWRALVIGALLLLAFTSSWTAHVVALAVLILVGGSYIYSWNLYERLDVRRRDKKLRCWPQQRFDVRIEFENRGLLPAPYLAVADRTGGLFAPGRDHRRTMAIRGRGSAFLEYQLEGYRRGVFTVGPVEITAADPLGLFPWRRLCGSTVEVVLYPNVGSVSLNHPRGIPTGHIAAASPIYEDRTRYRSVRAYVPGDDSRRINWKVSARLGQLHSTDFGAALDAPVLVALDLGVERYPHRYRYHLLERAVQTAATLALYFIDLRQEVALFVWGRAPTGGDRTGGRDAGGSQTAGDQSGGDGTDGYPVYLPPGSGRGHARLLLEALATVRETDGQTPVSLPSVAWGSRVCVVAPSDTVLAGANLPPTAGVDWFAIGTRGDSTTTVSGAPTAQSGHAGTLTVRFVKEYGFELV